MSTELSVQQKFEDKIKDRIRDSIGDLIPDEVLSQMTHKCLHSMFFDREKENKGSSSYPTWVEKPNFFDKIIDEMCKEKVRVFAETWMADNAMDIAKQVQERFIEATPKLIMSQFIQAIVEKAANHQFHDIQEIKNTLMQNNIMKKY